MRFTGCLAAFLQHLRHLYRQGNSYHNFQHALDVFQAVYFFLYCAGMVPPVTILLEDGRTWGRKKDECDPLVSCLTHEDLFALYIAAVGHDVGHPGLTNAFMVMDISRSHHRVSADSPFSHPAKRQDTAICCIR